MPRYEFVEGGSTKSWEIELAGNTFTVRFGKLGTDGQANTKVFDSPAAAHNEHDKLVASKVKTWTQIGTHAGLWTVLEHLDLYGVYGDGLMARIPARQPREGVRPSTRTE